jgi:hypothetical protein
MSDFWAAVLAFLNAVIDGISDYVHSDLAFVINTELADFVKFATDETVLIVRNILDIFGR